MLDDFQEKRNMIQTLLQMLKGSAADEVGHGLRPPEPMPEDAHGIEMEKVSVLPSNEDHAEPTSPEGESLADKVMSKGDEVSADHDAEPSDEGGSVESDLPAFASLMKKKGKK